MNPSYFWKGDFRGENVHFKCSHVEALKRKWGMRHSEYRNYNKYSDEKDKGQVSQESHVVVEWIPLSWVPEGHEHRRKETTS